MIWYKIYGNWEYEIERSDYEEIQELISEELIDVPYEDYPHFLRVDVINPYTEDLQSISVDPRDYIKCLEDL